MKNLFKKIVVMIALIMILLSSLVPEKAFADEGSTSSTGTAGTSGSTSGTSGTAGTSGGTSGTTGSSEESLNYNGLPAGGKFEAITFTDWIVDKLSGIVDWLIGAATYVIKAVVLGWTGIIEKVITELFSFGTATTVEGSLTVEKLVSNKVPILDVNFFNFETAGGRDLNSDSIVYLIRENIAQFYFIIRNVTIGGLLITLIYIGIRMAMSTVASTKAKYKAMLKGWLESMVLVFTIHYIMVFIIAANEWLVNLICNTIGAEESLYDTVRSQSYAIQASIGWPATIIYIMLIYLLIKFLFIYARRFINVAILTFLAPIIAIGFSIDKIKDGKSQSFSKWLKDYTVNVLLQSVHCLLYFIFITLAFNVAGQSIYGVVLALFLIMCIGKGEKVFKEIFDIESKSAPIGGMDDTKSWTKFAITAKVMKNAVGMNTKMLGKVGNVAKKPLNPGINKIKNAVRSNKINKIKQSLDTAKATGSGVIRVKNSVFSKGKDYQVDDLLEMGADAGYTTEDMAEMIHDDVEQEENQKSAERKAAFKRGVENTEAIIGMAMSIPMMAEGPILAAKHFRKHKNKLDIRGWKKDQTNYAGTIGEELKIAARKYVGTSGMAMSIPAFAINPALGATLLIASASMRKHAVTGYSTGNGSYTGASGGHGRIRTFAKNFANFNTMNVVPMARQVKANMTANQQKDLTKKLSYQYNLSSKMLQKRIDEEYEKLSNNPSIDKSVLDKLVKRAQHSVKVRSMGSYDPPKTITVRSIEEAVPIDASKPVVKNSLNQDSVVLKTDADTNIIHVCSAMQSYKSRGVDTVAEVDGFMVDSTKYSSAKDIYKAVLTKGGTLDEQSVLDRLNTTNGTNFKSLDHLCASKVEETRRNDLHEGKVYVSKTKLDRLTADEKKEIEAKSSSEEYVQRIVESATLESDTGINQKGLENAFTEIAKTTVAVWKGKDVKDVSDAEFSRFLGMMSHTQIRDILDVAGTRNSAIVSGNIPSEFERILSLMEKAKYNNYVSNQISYDSTQAAKVAERIRDARKRGVK